MTNHTANLNSQKPFLTQNQPTDETVVVLETLHNFFNTSKTLSTELDDSTVGHSFDCDYEKQLRECHLDYSLNSIKRIDKLLLSIKQSLPDFTEDKFFSSEDPIYNDSTIKVLSYYLGELIGRARREVPVWYYCSEAYFVGSKKAHSDIMSVEFDSDFQDVCDWFIPIQLIYQALLTSNNSGVLQAQTVWQSTLELIPPNVWDGVDFHQPLPPLPTMTLQFNRERAFANLDKADLAYLQVMPPSWMKDDVLYEQLNQLATLYKTGKVVWAYIVQANVMLFSADDVYSCPAEIVYDPTGRTPVTYLAEIARELYALKHTTPDSNEPEIVEYAKHITDESTRMVGFDIPSSITPLPLKSTTMFIWRLHLPNGVLHKPAFPILISDKTEAVTVLPAKFWDQNYYHEWMEDSYFHEDMYYGVRKLYDSENRWKKNKKYLRPKATELINEIPSLASEVSFNSYKPNSTDIDFAKMSIFKSFEDRQEKGIGPIKIIAGVLIFVALLKIIEAFI